jgi:hypothetical protein
VLRPPDLFAPTGILTAVLPLDPHSRSERVLPAWLSRRDRGPCFPRQGAAASEHPGEVS